MRIAAPALDALSFSRRDAQTGFSGRGAEVVVLEEPQLVDATPVGLHVQPGVRDRRAELRLRSHRRMEFDAPATFVARIPRGIVDAQSFVTFLPSGEYLAESVRSPRSLEGAGYASDGGVLRRADANVDRRPGTAVVLGNPTHRNWFHWWVEGVARLAVVKPFVRGGERFLVPPLRDWQLDALDVAGLPRELLETVDGDGLVAYDAVLVPSRGIGTITQFSPAALRALRAMCGSWPSRPGTAVYVSRRSAKRGTVQAETMVEEVMMRHGFRVVVAESLPVADQVRLFSDANVIAGAHGAGLANMLWAPPGSLVLELQPEGGDLGAATVYWHMSAALGHRYSACICPVAGDATRADLLVDVAHLDALLPSLLPAQESGAISSSSPANTSAR